MAEIEVRGPSADGSWFIVAVEGEEETALGEAYGNEAEAQAAATAMRMMDFLGTVLPLSNRRDGLDSPKQSDDSQPPH